METITLETKTLQQILNYLATQPYNEVVNLIQIIYRDTQNSVLQKDIQSSTDDKHSELLDLEL